MEKGFPDFKEDNQVMLGIWGRLRQGVSVRVGLEQTGKEKCVCSVRFLSGWQCLRDGALGALGDPVR